MFLNRLEIWWRIARHWTFEICSIESVTYSSYSFSIFLDTYCKRQVFHLQIIAVSVLSRSSAWKASKLSHPDDSFLLFFIGPELARVCFCMFFLSSRNLLAHSTSLDFWDFFDREFITFFFCKNVLAHSTVLCAVRFLSFLVRFHSKKHLI